MASVISTYISHCMRAIGFYYNTPNVMFGFGRQSPWGTLPGDNRPPLIYNDYKPPLPTLDTENLQEIIGYKRPEVMQFVIPNDTGNYKVDGIFWQIVKPNTSETNPDILKQLTIEEVKRLKCRWIYFATTIEGNELVNVSYRQIGLFSDLKINYLAGGTDNQPLYEADHIINGSGVLEAYQNRKMIIRQTDQREKFAFVIEF